MTVVALVSAKGSPGVTTSALALAAVWGRPVLVAECDPAGGDIAGTFLRGQFDTANGLLQLAVTGRHGLTANAVLGSSLRLDDAGTVSLLPGITDATQAAALRDAWGPLAETFVALGSSNPARDVLADCGRLDASPHGPTDVLARADVVVLVLRPTLAQVGHAGSRLAALRRDLRAAAVTQSALHVLVVGERPYPAREVAAVLDVPHVDVLPHDAAAAAALSGEAAVGRRFDRSGLIRAARTVAARLQQHAVGQFVDDQPVPAVPAPVEVRS